MKKIEDALKYPLRVGDEVAFIHQSLEKVNTEGVFWKTEFETSDEVSYEFKELHKNADYPMYLGVVTEVSVDEDENEHICIREDRYDDKKYIRNDENLKRWEIPVFEHARIILTLKQVNMLIKEHRLAKIEDLRKMK